MKYITLPATLTGDTHLSFYLAMEEYVAYQELVNESMTVWKDAKDGSDWNLFAPYLEKLITARRRFASLKAPDKPAYDVLLDLHEKDATMAELDQGSGRPGKTRARLPERPLAR